MLYFMSEGDFIRIPRVIEVINTMPHLLPNEDSEAILSWINNGMDTEFDQFCLTVSEEWSDSYPQVGLDDYESIAKIIHNTLNGVHTVELLKDTNGNLWNYVEYDEQSKLHMATVVDEDEGYYTNTSITCYLTDDELANCTKIEVEV